MSTADVIEDEFLAEPSWTTALSEADAASRHLRQATASMERLSRELLALREWSETAARLELAHALTDGPDGGALGALLVAASDPAGDPALRATAQTLLDRLTSALGLEPAGERGEFLRLRREDLVEFEVRESGLDSLEGERGLYCVVRPGWCLDAVIVVRPRVEPRLEMDDPETAAGISRTRAGSTRECGDSSRSPAG